jgi:hypothetical protein
MPTAGISPRIQWHRQLGFARVHTFFAYMPTIPLATTERPGISTFSVR